MKRLFSLFGKHKTLCALAAIFLCIQALFALAAPALLGDLIHTGVQKKGFDDAFPLVMSKNAFRLFRGILPAESADLLNSLYLFSDEAPTGLPKQYHGKSDCCYLRSEADHDEATRLYQNAVWVAILAARETGKLDTYDFDQLIEQVSLTTLRIYAESVSFTEAQIEHLFEEAEAAGPALKQQTASLLLPYIYEDAGLDCSRSQNAFVMKRITQFVICALLQFAAAVVSSRAVASLSTKTEAALRSELLHASVRFSKKEIRSFTPSHLCFVRQNGVAQVGMIIRFGFQIVFYAPVLAVVGSALSFRKSVPFGILVLSGSVLMAAVSLILYFLSGKRYYRMQRTFEKLSSRIGVILTQMFTVRSSGAQDSEQSRISALSDSVRRDESFVMKSVLSGLSIAGLILNSLTALVIAFGMRSMLSSDLNLGDILTYMQYSVLVVSAFMILGLAVIFAPKALIVLKDIDAILTTVPELSRYEKNTEVPGKAESVSFEDVVLYPCAPAIRFSAKKGSLTILTGEAGSGKTLLTEALMREHTPVSGRILINGTDIAAFSPAYPANTIVRVESRPCLFSATIRQNLRLNGAKGTDADFLNALACAECGFLVRRPEDLDLRLDDSGSGFSGGQRSRLSLAAAFTRKADIYIFDDCLTSVDRETRLRILNRMKELKKDAIVLIVMQDMSCAPDADQVVTFRREGIHAEQRGGDAVG